MQLFTIEQFFQMYIDGINIANRIISALFDASVQQIFKYLKIASSSFIHGDWNSLMFSLLTLVGSVAFVYYLARKKPMIVIKSIFGK